MDITGMTSIVELKEIHILDGGFMQFVNPIFDFEDFLPFEPRRKFTTNKG